MQRDEAEAQALIEPVATEIKQIAGLNYFGSNEDTLASVVGAILVSAQQNLSVAESCTGGGLGAMLTETPGSSCYFMGGIIAYANHVKQNLLGVEAQDLEQYGAVSQTVAQQMALGVKKKLGTDWGIGITGIAGPGGDITNKPVGLVYIGLATPTGTSMVREYRFGKQRGRDLIRHLSACAALDLLRRTIVQQQS